MAKNLQLKLKAVEKGVLKKFGIFTGKHLCWRIF